MHFHLTLNSKVWPSTASAYLHWSDAVWGSVKRGCWSHWGHTGRWRSVIQTLLWFTGHVAICLLPVPLHTVQANQPLQPSWPSFSSWNTLDSVSPRGPYQCNFLFLQFLTPFSFYSPFLYSNQISFWMWLPQRDFPQILRPRIFGRTFCQTSPYYLVLLSTIVTDCSCNDLLTANPSQWIRFLRANTLSALFSR